MSTLANPSGFRLKTAVATSGAGAQPYGRRKKLKTAVSNPSTLMIPMRVSLAAERRAKLAQIQHRVRWGTQQIFRPDIGVIGGYHHGNLGDMAMGYAVACRIKAKSGACALQTIYNLDRWPAAKRAIVGGGAVGYSECLRQLAARYGDKPERVAILGVDFNDPEALARHAEFLNRVAFITCRSARQAANVAQVLGREDVLWHPDLCFSLYKPPAENAAASDERPTFGINCVPLFLKRSGQTFVPGTSYLNEIRRENPDLVQHIDKLGLLYSELVRSVCITAKRTGFRVLHVPFTPLDDMFARAVLSDAEVEFVPYTSSVPSVLSSIVQCRQFFTTRFHSLVLSLLKHCAIIPFCYASKCDRLLEDLGVANESVIRVTDLLHGTDAIVERVMASQGTRLSTPTIKSASDRATAAIDAAIEAITR